MTIANFILFQGKDFKIAGKILESKGKLKENLKMTITLNFGVGTHTTTSLPVEFELRGCASGNANELLVPRY
jgi:hypothetical protein